MLYQQYAVSCCCHEVFVVVPAIVVVAVRVFAIVVVVVVVGVAIKAAPYQLIRVIVYYIIFTQTTLFDLIDIVDRAYCRPMSAHVFGNLNGGTSNTRRRIR